MTCIEQMNNFKASIQSADINGDGLIVTSTLRDANKSINKTELTMLMKDIARIFQIGKYNTDSIQEVLRYLDSLDDDDQCSKNNECGDGIIIVRNALTFIEMLKTDKNTQNDFIKFLNTTISSYQEEKETKRTLQVISDLKKIIDMVKKCDCPEITSNKTYIKDISYSAWYMLNK